MNQLPDGQRQMHYILNASLTFTFRAFSRRFYPKRLTSFDTHVDIPESTMQGDSQLVRSS